MSTTSYPQLPRNIVQLKQLQEASRHLLVFPYDTERGRYMVESASEPGRYYHVALEQDALAGRCTCTWAQYGGINCKHVLAALRARYASSGTLSFWPTRDDARRQHRRVWQGQQIYATLRPRRQRPRDR